MKTLVKRILVCTILVSLCSSCGPQKVYTTALQVQQETVAEHDPYKKNTWVKSPLYSMIFENGEDSCPTQDHAGPHESFDSQPPPTMRNLKVDEHPRIHPDIPRLLPLCRRRAIPRGEGRYPAAMGTGAPAAILQAREDVAVQVFGFGSFHGPASQNAVGGVGEPGGHHGSGLLRGVGLL